MSRPLISRNGEPLDQKFQMMLSKSELGAIDDWMFANRIRGRAEAIRSLCRTALTGPEASRIDALVAALREAREYFAERADAEYTTESASPVGNTEMSLLVEIDEALKKAGA